MHDQYPAYLNRNDANTFQPTLYFRPILYDNEFKFQCYFVNEFYLLISTVIFFVNNSVSV